jgi:hypothetical protein
VTLDLVRSAALETWLGAAGVYAYLAFILSRRRRSSLEHRMILVLICLGGMFLVRGFEWLTGAAWLRQLNFAHASLLPLAGTLLTEGLMRRHVHLPLKLFIATGTTVFFVWNLLTGGDIHPWFTAFSVFVLVSLGWLFAILVTRDRGELSPGENQLIGALSVAFGIGALVAFTDFSYRPSWMPLGMGSVGGLIFIYACVRLSRAADTGGRVFSEVLGWTVQAACVAAGVAFVLRGATLEVKVVDAVLALSGVMLFGVLFRLHELRGRGRARAFLNALLEADARSLDDFLRDVQRMPIAEKHVVLRGRDLEPYDAPRLVELFDRRVSGWSVSEVRTGLRRGTIARDAGEQLLDALGTHGMTHATLLRVHPPALLLLNLPELAGEQDPREELGLLGKLARLIPSEGAPVAAERE